MLSYRKRGSKQIQHTNRDVKMINSTITIVIGFAALVLVIVLVLHMTPSHTPPPVEDRILEEGAEVADAEQKQGDIEDIDPAAANDGSAVFNQEANADFSRNYHAAVTTRPEMAATRDRPERMTRYHGLTDGILKAAGRGHEQGEVGSQVPAMIPMSS